MSNKITDLTDTENQPYVLKMGEQVYHLTSTEYELYMRQAEKNPLKAMRWLERNMMTDEERGGRKR